MMPSSYSFLALFCKLRFSFLLSLLFPLVLFPSSSISIAGTAIVLNTNVSTSNYESLPSTHHPYHHKCIHQHLFALLQLKRGFDLSHSVTNLSSWNANNPDCCYWEGIHCNPFTGHVISLNLSGLFISGLLDFQSLFQLWSLERLDLSQSLESLGLSGNYKIDGSLIPSGFAQLSNLTHLHLSLNQFHGRIPPDIFQLTRLVSLDLSYNRYDNASNNVVEDLYLERSTSSVEQLFGNLSGLRELFLDGANLSVISSQWSQILSYAFPNLRKLSLSDCSLSGAIHPSFFRLDSLIQLDLSYNDLSSRVPEFIPNLNALNSRVNLSKLMHFDLFNNNFQGPIPIWIFELKELQFLRLSFNHFSGVVELGCFQNLKNLEWLDLSYNNFSAITNTKNSSTSITQPSVNLSQLSYLSLSNNNFQGPIPILIFELTELIELYLSSDNFIGVIDLSLLQNLKNLKILDLSDNSLTVTTDPKSSLISTSFPQLLVLYLRSCNISNFPNILRNQESIGFLDLSKNRIHGKIPHWIWKVGNGRMYYLNLSNNALEGLERPFPHRSLTSMNYFDLSSNSLKGSILIPPASSSFFSLANNKLNGEVPSLICKAKLLEVFDLSNNNFSGLVPQCLGKINNGIFRVVNLAKNAFHGPLFQTFKVGCTLETLDLSDNYLVGQMPRSLTNCQMLRVLNLGNNQIHDRFPLQLGNLSNLHVLVLRSNNFFGSIEVPWTSQKFFPQLQIIDLSFNNFNGRLPSNLFSTWKTMKDGGSASKFLTIKFSNFTNYYQDKVFLIWKGIEVEFVKILMAITVVDLSHNQLEGDIPTSIGELKALRVLNLSHNHFQDEIPALLQNLRDLESLDLSNNNLSGKIPWQLAGLSFLAVLNLSENQLTGRIPQGRHFDTFQNDSFLGNSELCGLPLSRKCEEDAVATPPATQSNNEEIDLDLMWIAFGVGHGVGFGMFFWTLALWRRGRRAFLMFIDRVFFSYFPYVV